ncbi:SEC-C metal-binding domain-containing protein [Vibrio splendidus]
MTSILIANHAQRQVKYGVESIDKSSRSELLMGYFSEQEVEKQNESTLSSFFISLLTHEEIYLNDSTLQLVLDCIGSSSLLKLLEHKIIKICFGLGSNALVIGKDKHELTSLYAESSDINRFEEHLSKKVSSKNSDFNTIIQYVDNSCTNLDESTTNLGTKEIIADLSNSKIKTDFGLCSGSISEIEPIDTLRILRLSDVAQNLVIQSELKITSMYQDGYANKYINTKLGALAPLVGNEPTQAFTNIINKKGIPDIYHLYKKGVIDIDDILICRNTFNGGIFRNWLESVDYEENSILEKLINKNSQSKINKFIRYLYPNVFGLVSPIAGAAAGAFDSYIMNRVMDGWSPSLFLDDVLKENIDNKVKLFEQKSKREEFIKRFGSVARNELCPCQSGKKYKKCHGR